MGSMVYNGVCHVDIYIYIVYIMKPAITETITCCAVRLYMLVEATQDQHDFSCRWLKVKTPLLLAVVKTRTLSRYLSHRFIPDFVAPFNVFDKMSSLSWSLKKCGILKTCLTSKPLYLRAMDLERHQVKGFLETPLFNSFRYMCLVMFHFFWGGAGVGVNIHAMISPYTW